MTDQGKKLLSDILSAIILIEEFTANINSFDDYNNDLKDLKIEIHRKLE